MLHPFIDNDELAKITSEQLQLKITELLRKRTVVMRMQPNLVSQIDMVIDSYMTESRRRDGEAFNKLQMQNNIRITKTP